MLRKEGQIITFVLPYNIKHLLRITNMGNHPYKKEDFLVNRKDKAIVFFEKPK